MESLSANRRHKRPRTPPEQGGVETPYRMVYRKERTLRKCAAILRSGPGGLSLTKHVIHADERTSSDQKKTTTTFYRTYGETKKEKNKRRQTTNSTQNMRYASHAWNAVRQETKSLFIVGRQLKRGRKHHTPATAQKSIFLPVIGEEVEHIARVLEVLHQLAVVRENLMFTEKKASRGQVTGIVELAGSNQCWRSSPKNILVCTIFLGSRKTKRETHDLF